MDDVFAEESDDTDDEGCAAVSDSDTEEADDDSMDFDYGDEPSSPGGKASLLPGLSKSAIEWISHMATAEVEEMRKGHPKYYIHKWSLPRRNTEGPYYEVTLFEMPQLAEKISISDLPDEFLSRIFGHLHAYDRLHSASLVCRRWHDLVYAPGVWTQARMVLHFDKPAHCDAVKKFLHRPAVSSSLERLQLLHAEALESTDPEATNVLKRMQMARDAPFRKHMLEAYGLRPDFFDDWNPESNTRTIDLLPTSFPNLLQLQADFDYLEEELTFYDGHMPNLRTLVLRKACKRKTASRTQDYAVAFKGKAFQNLRALGIDGWSDDVSVAEFLLNIPNVEELQLFGNSSSAMMRSRAGDQFPTNCEGLRKLSFVSLPTTWLTWIASIASGLTVLDLRASALGAHKDLVAFMLTIRRLHSLEHLHLWNGHTILQELFEPADEEGLFPSRLKYLCIRDGDCIGDERFTALISASCPQLRSLCLSTQEVSDFHVLHLTRGLRKLRFLRLTSAPPGIIHMVANLFEDEFPELCLLKFDRLKDYEPSKGAYDPVLRDVRSLQRNRPSLMLVFGFQSGTLQYCRFNETVVEEHAAANFERRAVWDCLDCEDGVCCVTTSNIERNPHSDIFT